MTYTTVTTYSVGLYGQLAGGEFAPARQVEVPDADSTGSGCASNFAALQGTMQTGALVLTKMPDGSQRWCRFDAERSTFANPILVPV